LATADINGDQIPDLITAPGQGGGPHVRILDGATGVEMAGFFAFQGGNPQGGFSKMRGSTNAPDADGDSLPDAIEKVFFGTTPDNFDSDGDLLPDGVEARTPGLRPTVQDDADGDYDADGLTNLDEVIFRTRLDQRDTDTDGVSDAGEVAQGSDPLDRSDSTAPDPSELVELRLSVGDPSGSKSERYNLVVGNVAHQAPNFGEVSTGIYKFRRGRDYPIQIVHRGTDPNFTGSPKPDYDYFAAIDSPAGSLQQAIVTIEDPSGILGEHNESQPFYAAGKQAVLRVGKVFTISPLRQSLKVAESRRPTGERTGTDYQYDDGRYPLLSFDINQQLSFRSFPSYQDTIVFEDDSDPEDDLKGNLFGYMSLSQGGQLGNEMVRRFLAGTGADFEHQDGSVLSDAVRESTQFKDLVKQTQDGIQDAMNRQAQTGFIDPARFGGLPIRVDNPFFNDILSFLSAVLGGTQRTDVGLIEFTADGTIAPASGTGTYRAKLRFEIYDDFGVDEKDLGTVRFLGFDIYKPLFDFYILQHERSGHRPFVNHVTVTVPIEGRFTIPPGYGKVDKVP
jgi:hypothetical protein